MICPGSLRVTADSVRKQPEPIFFTCLNVNADRQIFEAQNNVHIQSLMNIFNRMF